jgi:hypothetical protein
VEQVDNLSNQGLLASGNVNMSTRVASIQQATALCTARGDSVQCYVLQHKYSAEHKNRASTMFQSAELLVNQYNWNHLGALTLKRLQSLYMVENLVNMHAAAHCSALL